MPDSTRPLGRLYRIGLPVVLVLYLGLSLLAAWVSSSGLAAGTDQLGAEFLRWSVLGYLGCCLSLPLLFTLAATAVLWLWKREPLWIAAIKTAFWITAALLPLVLVSFLISAVRRFAD